MKNLLLLFVLVTLACSKTPEKPKQLPSISDDLVCAPVDTPYWLYSLRSGKHWITSGCRLKEYWKVVNGKFVQIKKSK
jgi:hypothetical protein